MRRLIGVVCVVSLFSCELFAPKPEPTPPVDAPASPRLADWKLPFALADDLPITDGVSRLNYERSVEVGPQVGLSLFTSNGGGLTTLVPDSLVAVAALPDRVVVVFAAAPDGVMTIAQGGLDRPWSAQPLDVDAPVLRWQVGALDAVAAPDGSVLIAVRRRPFQLALYRWTTDGVVTKEHLPVAAPASEHWSTSRCPDVRLDASANGGVVLAYHAGKHTALAWRKPGAPVWTAHETPPLEYDASVHYDLGCVSRVLFDDSGFPQLLTLVRTWQRKPTAPEPYDPMQPGTSDPAWSRAGEHPIGLVGRTPPLTGMNGYVMLANGALSRSANASLPAASLVEPHAWHNGFFSFDRHPAGYLVSGPNVDWRGGTLVNVSLRAHDPVFDSASPLPAFSWRVDLPASAVETTSGGMTLIVDPSEVRRVSDFEHLAFEPCGDVTAVGSGSTRTNLAVRFSRNSAGACPGVVRAPVQRPEPVQFDAVPVFAHGRRPYEVGVCSAGTQLGICYGGWAPLKTAALPEETTPKLVASAPASGPVPLETDHVVFTLSRAIGSDERVFAHFSDVNRVENTQVVPELDGAQVTVRFPQALKAGSTYRVGLSVTANGEGQWLYLDGAAPVATFTTAKSPGVVDPRLMPTPFRCPGVRVDGICEVSDLVRGVTGITDDVGFGYNFAARPLGPPSIYDAQGNRVTDAAGDVLSSGTTRFTWGTSLARDAKYELRYPEGILTFDGTEFLPEDLKLVFRTRPN